MYFKLKFMKSVEITFENQVYVKQDENVLTDQHVAINLILNQNSRLANFKMFSLTSVLVSRT